MQLPSALPLKGKPVDPQKPGGYKAFYLSCLSYDRPVMVQQMIF
jgi:hypothetical protein